jgi:predicted transcriptional regulator
MHILGAFELDIRPGTPNDPASVRIALQKAVFDPSGRVFVSPECSTFEEIEGQINSLQDELDEIRERARRAFQVA